MPRATNPREISDEALDRLLANDLCPMCIGHLDTGYECTNCGFDASELVKVIGLNFNKAGGVEATLERR
jgi:hypothetical protein